MNLSTEAGPQWAKAADPGGAQGDGPPVSLLEHTHNELLSSDSPTMTYKALTYLHSRDACLHIAVSGPGLDAAKLLFELCTKHGEAAPAVSPV